MANKKSVTFRSKTRLTGAVNINGTTYPVNSQFEVTVNKPEDIEKLRKIPSWEDMETVEANIKFGADAMVAKMVKSPQLRAELLATGGDEDKLEALIKRHGFRCTPTEFKEAGYQFGRKNPDVVKKWREEEEGIKEQGKAPAPEPELEPVDTNDVNQRHVDFLNHRGYPVKTVDEAMGFIAALKLAAQAAFFEDAAKWTPPDPSNPEGGTAQGASGSTPPGPPPPPQEWKIPDESKGEAWPAPTEAMPVEFLKAMADRYSVKYAPNIGAAKLVERLQETFKELTNNKAASE